MAKQEKTNSTASERPMPVHPDPDKETILLRYPEDGSVKAVSNLIQDNKGNQEIVTTDPTTKNQPAFYQKRDSLFIANFFKNMRAQMQDPAKMPELYIVSFDKVGAVAADLRKLHEDPQNEVLLETAKKYRTYTQNLEKIIFDECRMPKAELAAAGFDVKQMEQDGIFKEMELGKEPQKLYPLKSKLNEQIQMDGLYAIKAVKNEYNEIGFELQSPLAIPEFEQDATLSIELSAEDKKALAAGKTLERPIRHDGEYCVAGFNRTTNRMTFIPCREIQAPEYVFNARMSEEQQEEYKRGRKVHLDNCHYYGNDNTFSCDVQYDTHTRDYRTTGHHYQRPYVPDYLARQLDDTRMRMLLAYEPISGKGLTDRNGMPLKRDICIDRNTNGVTYVSLRRMEQEKAQAQAQSQQQAGKQAAGAPVQSENDMHVDNDIPEQSQSRGHRR